MQAVFEKIINDFENKSYERYGNDGMGGEKVVNLDDAIEIVKQEAEQYEPCHKPCTDCEEYDLARNHCPKFCKVIKETVKEIEENKSGWIPCSERLPDNSEHDWVLAQVQEDNGYLWIPRVMEYRESKDDWYMNDGVNSGWMKEMHGDAFKVIAWQPLPQPFKKGE